MASRESVVVGAGIVGASIAYHLAKLGHTVTLIDAGLPGSGATAASFAWIGRPRSSTSRSAQLRFMAVDEWHRLHAAVPAVNASWPGAITWGEFGAEDGTPWTRDIASIEPQLRLVPDAVQERPDDGYVDPVAATEALVEAARRRGARVLLGDSVREVTCSRGAVDGVRTGSGTISADTVVLTNGTGVAALADRLGVAVPVRASPSLMFRFANRPGVVRGIVAGDRYEVRQLPDGSLLSPAAYKGETSRSDLRERGLRVATILQDSFEGLGPLELRSAEIGWRPMPQDGEPIIGPLPGVDGLYLAVMHSGVTLAAAVGRLVAAEIATGETAQELIDCR